MKHSIWLALLAGSLLMGARPLHALINPNFTPVHLVREAETILEISFDGRDADGRLKAVTKAVLKGKQQDQPKEFFIDPRTAIAEGQRDTFMDAALRKGQRALLFTGAFRPVGASGGEMNFGAGDSGGPLAIAFLHMDSFAETQWAVLEQWEKGQWEFVKGENFLLATYNGATDMLRRMVDYILLDPEADVPVSASAQWRNPVARVGRVEGTVLRADAVYLTPPANPWTADLFLARREGDRLYRWREGGLKDITEETRLDSRSKLHTWGDFNGDGRLDLASYDGRVLTLHLQGQNGVFEVRPVAGAQEIFSGEYLSLATLGDDSTRAVLLAGTRRGPVLIVFDEQGNAVWRSLTEATDAGADTGGGCLVADFDGDGKPDILELGAKSSRWYRAIAAARFAPPQTVAVHTGSGPHGPVLGDFDQDGLLDVFIAAEESHLLWQNRGNGMFEEVMGHSGEVSYKHTNSGILALAEDFNNDGRVDLLIAYGVPRPPYILYNRGFRSFAHALDLDLHREAVLPQTEEGQQAITFGDFDGDGFSDLAIVLRDGEIRLVQIALDNQKRGLVLCAALPRGGTGPIPATATRFERPLGARLALPGRPAVFGAREPGPIEITWRSAGREEQRREVVLEEGPSLLILE